MIRHEIKSLSNTVASNLDIQQAIKSAYTLIIQNVNSSGYIYVGNNNVTNINYGFKLYPTQIATIELPSRNSLYAVSSQSEMNISIMEIDRAI